MYVHICLTQVIKAILQIYKFEVLGITLASLVPMVYLQGTNYYL